MKASELRIGNLVSYFDKKKTVVKLERVGGLWYVGAGNYIGDLMNVWNVDDSFKPIPLTEEWLLKFGFEKYETGIDGDKMVYYDFGKLTICNWGEGLIMSNAFAHGIRVPLKYVHQLQNLYFALTDDELAYN